MSNSPLFNNPDLSKKLLPEVSDMIPDKKILRETTPNLDQRNLSTVRTKSVGAPGKDRTPGSHRTPRHKTSPSQINDGSVTSKTRDILLQRHVTENFEPKQTSKPFLHELPVREEKRTDWSLSSNDSENGLQIPRLSYSGRKVEPVKPFSVSAASNCDFGEFGGLTPDTSDLTVYNEITKKTPRNIPDFNSGKMLRQPTPGSEASKQFDICSKPLFSELRQKQQDSGFGSPFYQQKLQ